MAHVKGLTPAGYYGVGGSSEKLETVTHRNSSNAPAFEAELAEGYSAVLDERAEVLDDWAVVDREDWPEY